MTDGRPDRCAQQNSLYSPPALSFLTGKELTMLSTLLIVLLVLWLLGMVTSYTMGGLIHILIVVAIVIVLLNVIQGRNPLRG
jgi:uncharacterized protein DUF5670